ncbi:hypothetical protein YC2023_045010 [Brassica napus]
MEKRSRTNVLRVMILEDYEKFANERHGPAMSEASIEIVDDAFIHNFLELKLWADEMSDMGRLIENEIKRWISCQTKFMIQMDIQ